MKNPTITNAHSFSIADCTSRMTSREISELTEKRHDHVLRDIKSLIAQNAISGPSFGVVEYIDAKGEKRPMYSLDFQATMTLITGYNAVLRSKVIASWIELEKKQAATPSENETGEPSEADIIARSRVTTKYGRQMLAIGHILAAYGLKHVAYRHKVTRKNWNQLGVKSVVCKLQGDRYFRVRDCIEESKLPMFLQLNNLDGKTLPLPSTPANELPMPDSPPNTAEEQFMLEKLKLCRFFVTIDPRGIKIEAISKGMVISPEDIPKVVGDPDCMVPRSLLPAIIKSAADRLSGVEWRDERV